MNENLGKLLILISGVLFYIMLRPFFTGSMGISTSEEKPVHAVPAVSSPDNSPGCAVRLVMAETPSQPLVLEIVDEHGKHFLTVTKSISWGGSGETHIIPMPAPDVL